MVGLGWVAYAFATENIFVLVSNLPGLILSIWLNAGAAKLQYIEKYETMQSLVRNDHSLRLEEEDNEDNGRSSTSTGDDEQRREDREDMNLPTSTSHEFWVISILIVWGLTLSSVVFIPMSNRDRGDIIGIVVNLNLVIFYGAPLSTIIQVFKTRSSVSIHRKTLGRFLFIKGHG